MLNRFNAIYGKNFIKESYNFKIALTKLFFTNARKLIKGYDLLECFCLK